MNQDLLPLEIYPRSILCFPEWSKLGQAAKTFLLFNHHSTFFNCIGIALQSWMMENHWGSKIWFFTEDWFNVVFCLFYISKPSKSNKDGQIWMFKLVWSSSLVLVYKWEYYEFCISNHNFDGTSNLTHKLTRLKKRNKISGQFRIRFKEAPVILSFNHLVFFCGKLRILLALFS